MGGQGWMRAGTDGRTGMILRDSKLQLSLPRHESRLRRPLSSSLDSKPQLAVEEEQRRRRRQ